MTLKNAEERYEEAERNRIQIQQEKERVLAEFWQSELGEFLINEIEKRITLESERGLFEVEIMFNSNIWMMLTKAFPNRELPELDTVAYDVVAMYEDNGFKATFLGGLIPRLIIKW